MNEMLAIMVQPFPYYACTEASFFKRPHPTIFDQDWWWESGWLLGWFWSLLSSTCD
jgi:hypothetical protein